MEQLNKSKCEEIFDLSAYFVFKLSGWFENFFTENTQGK